MTDCTRYKGRLYDLCTGKGHDGRPDPDPEMAARWRERQLGENPESDTRAFGLGDAVELVTKITGVKTVVQFYSRVTGKPCNCPGRKKRWNRITLFRRKV